MGKLVADYTFPVVQQAVSAAVTAQPADAREYLKAACQRAAGQRNPASRQPVIDTAARNAEAKKLLGFDVPGADVHPAEPPPETGAIAHA